MQVDVLIVGQGLCGTHLSRALQKEGKTFLVIDEARKNSASKIAAGIINPVTGRRYVTTWMIEDLIDFAKIVYTDLGDILDMELMQQKSIIDFFPSPQMRNAFVERVSEDDTYLHSYPDQNDFNSEFNYDFDCGEVRPAYTVNVQALLKLWREMLVAQQLVREEKFRVEELKVEAFGVHYEDISASKIIFCDGIAAAQNPWFSLLPFSANKGEALVVECVGLNNDHIYKKGLMLAPLAEENIFWLGSNYQWEFEDDNPSESFYKNGDVLLKSWLKKPYKILEHKAGVRPATLERRPFVGFHPQHRAVGILNGMGTKGASLAPFFAHQLAQHIAYNFPIAPEADVHRFCRILSK